MYGSKYFNLRKASAVIITLALILSCIPLTTVNAAEAVTIYRETFANGRGIAVQSGGANLSAVDMSFQGNDDGKALYVSNRKNTWDAADFNFSQLKLENEKNYDITIKGYIDQTVTNVSPGAVIVVQPVKPSANAYGAYIGTSTVVPGLAFTITAAYQADATTYDRLRIQSNDAGANVPFYIGDILITSEDSTGGSPDPEPLPIQNIPSVKDTYKDDFLIGTCANLSDLEGTRLDLMKKHYNVITGENAMKPESLQREKGVFTFTEADNIVNKALQNGIQVHGHTLVWHGQTPAWMNSATDESGSTVPLSREEALLNMRTHIRTVVEHFGDKVISWDVVNEAMSDNPANPTNWKAALRQSNWMQSVGPDFVEQAFLITREVIDEHGWDIKLYYNDYNDDNQNKATAIYSMVKEINENYQKTHPGKLLIDGIGMQAHYNTKTNPANVKLSLERFLSLGVEVSVTELDIGGGENNQLTEKGAKEQAYLYAQLFQLYKAHADKIARVTLWGMDDAHSWRAENSPLIFDSRLQAKPAYYAVIDPDRYLEEHVPEAPAESKKTTATYGTPVVDGDIDAIWQSTPEVDAKHYLMARQGAASKVKALWDDNNLYILMQVTDTQLNKANANAWEQDSVEVFVDENNEKTTFYQEDDGQYRINYENQTSFNPASIANGFESAVKVAGTNYTVEMKIPFKTVTPVNNLKLGFDAQVNDATDGSRTSVATWNDTTGNAYQDTSVYGVLTLKGKGTADDKTVTFNSNGGTAVAPQTIGIDQAAAEPAAPRKTGYTFSGWYKDSGLTQAYDFAAPVSQDITLFAKWVKISGLKVTLTSTNGSVTGLKSEYSYGDKVTLKAVADTNYKFAGWIDSLGKVLSTNAAYSFSITRNTKLTAKFVEKTSYTVTFFNGAKQVISSQTVTKGGSAVAPADPVKPDFVFTGWNVEFSNVQSDLAIYPVFKAKEVTYQLKVNNGVGTGAYTGSTIATVAAIPDGKIFGGWQDEKGNIISYSPVYSFIITRNMELTAILLDTAQELQPKVTMDTNVTYNTVDPVYVKMFFLGTFAVPSQYQMVECGFISIKNAAENPLGTLTLQTPGITIVKAEPLNAAGQAYRIIKTTYGSKFYVRGYMICKNTATGEIITVYSADVAEGLSQSTPK